MARITDKYVKMQKRCRPNIDASHRCIFRCPNALDKNFLKNKYVEVLILKKTPLKKILDYYDFGITFCGQISDPIYHPKFLELLLMCDGQGKAVRIETVGSG